VAGIPSATADPALAVDDRGPLAVTAAVPGPDGREVRLWREVPGVQPWPSVALGGPTTTPEPAFYARPQAAGVGSAVGVVAIAGPPAATDGVTDVVFHRAG
jgi:hypothetical protein